MLSNRKRPCPRRCQRGSDCVHTGVKQEVTLSTWAPNRKRLCPCERQTENARVRTKVKQEAPVSTLVSKRKRPCPRSCPRSCPCPLSSPHLLDVKAGPSRRMLRRGQAERDVRTWTPRPVLGEAAEVDERWCFSQAPSDIFCWCLFKRRSDWCGNCPVVNAQQDTKQLSSRRETEKKREGKNPFY